MLSRKIIIKVLKKSLALDFEKGRSSINPEVFSNYRKFVI